MSSNKYIRARFNEMKENVHTEISPLSVSNGEYQTSPSSDFLHEGHQVKRVASDCMYQIRDIIRSKGRGTNERTNSTPSH
jgi:hypothetical protein